MKANFANKTTSEKLYSEEIIIVKVADTYKVYSSKDAIASKDDLYVALINLLLNGNKVA